MPTVKINEQQKEWAIKAAAGMVACLFCYIVLIHPVFRDIAISRQSIIDSQKRNELYREVRGLRESLDSRERVLSTVAERAQIIEKVSALAGKNQLRVETLTPRSELDGEYTKLKMEMNGQGTFFSLLKFLRAVEKIGASIKVRDISLLWNPSLDAKVGEYFLRIQLELETYLKQRIK